jgi:allantoin racemase
LRRVLLINPNSSRDTTAMMTAIAQGCGAGDLEVTGITATRSPPMIANAQALAASAAEVVAIGMREAARFSGIVVSAFGDPGSEDLKRSVPIPVVGIAEASMREAAAGGRFGIATTTAELAVSIESRVRDLGLAQFYTGIRLTPGDPVRLTADAAHLEASLRKAVAECFDIDGAEAVIIGGGPLGQAAIALASLFVRPVIAPIPAAMRHLARMMSG